jgi:hypothetical protein
MEEAVSGANHERVPGCDTENLIGCEEGRIAGTWDFVVRVFGPMRQTVEVGRLTFCAEQDARDAEQGFRRAMQTCADQGGKVGVAMKVWFDNMADLKDWWA